MATQATAEVFLARLEARTVPVEPSNSALLPAGEGADRTADAVVGVRMGAVFALAKEHDVFGSAAAGSAGRRYGADGGALELVAARAGGGRDMLERAEYAMKSMEEVRRLIRNHGWALLVVGSSGDLRAGHVPCLLDSMHDAGGAGEQLVIIGHTARADPVVSGLLSGHEVLLVFQGPNGYISPAWYGEGPSPPTWNFTAVHVRGIPEVLEGEEAFSVLERTVEHFEAARDDPWELCGDALAYARQIAHETAPFRVRSAAIQAKAKLSQDKPRRIQERVIAALQEGGPYQNAQLAAEMRRVLGESTRTASPTKEQVGAPVERARQDI